jgi:hypothetical protein
MELREFTTRVVICALVGVLAAVLVVLLFGLFDPRIDNKSIMEIIKPSFQDIIGAFLLILGREIGRNEK